ncbi:hypothetical protein UFOVP33_74 [uncultured Caudovirales phage]|uniref:Uncharacterized protein n=1 Tax=uncultured Caudovirales phage TaxID=2100421 RepID=A0A6J5KPT2_9CAUD|nr:hypothetical protein UFOVP33_74 [uncultured Caudovirales phage]
MVKAISAGINEARIRASVSFVAPAVEVTAAQVVASAAIVESASMVGVHSALAGVSYVIPAALLQTVSIVLNVVLDPIGRNPFLYDMGVVSDTATLSVGKVLTELAASSDVQHIVFGKNPTDTAHTSHVHTFQVEKSLADLKSTIEGPFFVQDFVDASYFAEIYLWSKGYPTLAVDKVLADVGDAYDFVSVQPEKVASDASYTFEGPYNDQDYADKSYFAETYVGTSGPVFVIGKNLTENLIATDDFLGAANIDDDQVMVFGKTLTDPTTASESMAKGFARGVADSAHASDTPALTTGKGLADVIASSQIVVRQVDKNSTDTANTSETRVARVDKVLSEFPVTGDLKTFSLAKVATDSVASSDAAVRGTAKAFTDSVSKSDAAVRTTGKALADSAHPSDAGTLRKTDYSDITYFAEAYVGSTLNF